MRSLFQFVLIKLRHCGHLALSSCLTLRAKLLLCLVVLKACVPKLCVLLHSAVLRGSLFGMCVMIVTSCNCQLDFNKGLLLLLLLLLLLKMVVETSKCHITTLTARQELEHKHVCIIVGISVVRQQVKILKITSWTRNSCCQCS